MDRQEALDTWLTHVDKGLGQCRIYNGSCMYYSNGNMCAVGTLMKEPENYAAFVGNVKDIIDKNFEALEGEAWVALNEQDTDEDGSFLMSLQQLHDDAANWNGVYLAYTALYDFKRQWGLN